jgi:Zinc knuckle
LLPRRRLSQRAYRERHPGRQSDRKQRSKQPDRGEGSSRDQRRQSKRSETRQDTRQDDSKPRLSADEQQHRIDKNLCFNCGYPGHRKIECTYPFNPNRVAPKSDNQAKAQPLRSKKRPRAKVQPVNASDHDDTESVVHTTEDSDGDERETRPSKRSKN